MTLAMRGVRKKTWGQATLPPWAQTQTAQREAQILHPVPIRLKVQNLAQLPALPRLMMIFRTWKNSYLT